MSGGSTCITYPAKSPPRPVHPRADPGRTEEVGRVRDSSLGGRPVIQAGGAKIHEDEQEPLCYEEEN